MNKKKIITVLIVIATFALAGVAIFTAIRLYQLRQEPVAPTAPEEPEAAAPQTQACTQLAFTISAEEPTPTPTGSPTPTPTASPTATPTASPTATPTASPTASPTATPTASPTSSPVAESSPSPEVEPAIPEAGISFPTLFGLGLGILALLFALLLAF